MKLADRTVLKASDLRVELANGSAIIEDVSFELRAGEILGLVGESGSGKTTTARSLFGHHERGIAQSSGEITLAGDRLATMESFMRARGGSVSYVPQNPGTSLNPSLRILAAIEDMLRAHHAAGPDRAAVAGAAGAQLGRVGLPADREFAPPLPAPALRRPAAACLHRDRPVLRSRRRGPRRADHRPGRRHPGQDPAGADPAARRARRRHALHHARPRRGGADR